MPDDRICGLNAVRALFQHRPDDVNRLYYTEALKEVAGPLCQGLAQARRPYRMLPDDEMQRAADASLTCFNVLARRAGRLAAGMGRA